jgi:hypothetical protein
LILEKPNHDSPGGFKNGSETLRPNVPGLGSSFKAAYAPERGSSAVVASGFQTSNEEAKSYAVRMETKGPISQPDTHFQAWGVVR